MLQLLPNTFAQDNTQWGVPEGARTRLGRGRTGEIRYSPDGTRLAVGSGIGIWLYDTATYQEISLLTGQSEEIFNIAFSPDGKTIASGCYDGTICLWDIGTGTHETRLTTYKVSVNSVAFSPEGRTLACGSDDGTVLTQFHIKKSAIRRTLACGSDDGTVRLWDAHTSASKITPTGHTDSVSSVAFSPDGKILASGSRDGNIHLWDADTGEYKKTLTGHTFWVTSLAFSPDGKTLASGSLDSTVLLWELFEAPPPTPQ